MERPLAGAVLLRNSLCRRRATLSARRVSVREFHGWTQNRSQIEPGHRVLNSQFWLLLLISWFDIFTLANSMSRSRNAIVATGLVVFAAGGLAFPFCMASSRQPVIDPTKPLPPQATFRGPYINTGSRDIGPDRRTQPEK